MECGSSLVAVQWHSNPGLEIKNKSLVFSWKYLLGMGLDNIELSLGLCLKRGFRPSLKFRKGWYLLKLPSRSFPFSLHMCSSKKWRSVGAYEREMEKTYWISKSMSQEGQDIIPFREYYEVPWSFCIARMWIGSGRGCSYKMQPIFADIQEFQSIQRPFLLYFDPPNI